MGYAETPNVVHASVGLLDKIWKAVREGREVVMEMNPKFIPRQLFRVNRALASAALFRTLYGGKYAELREQVSCKVERGDKPAIRIIPKAGISPQVDSLHSGEQTDLDVLTHCAQSRPARLAVSFRWTVMQAGDFEHALNAQGFEIVTIRGDDAGASALIQKVGTPSPADDTAAELGSVPVDTSLEDILDDFKFD